MKLDVHDIDNKKVDTIDLSDGLFGVKWNPKLVHQVATAMLANKRSPWASTKDRSEVSGGGKKPWRQKGTGRARAGSTRSPIWTGGGVTHGPLKERDYSQKINKKMKRAALLSVISKKVNDGDLKIIDSFKIEKPKTKTFASSLGKILGNTKKKKTSALIVAPQNKKELIMSGRNIPKTFVVYSNSLNIRDCLSHKIIIFEKKAIDEFVEQYSKK